MSRFQNIDEFLILLKNTKPIGNGEYQALCPAHKDRNPSLNIKLSDNKILLKCQAGCLTPDVVKSINLTMADLFIGAITNGGTVPIKCITNTYDYVNESGKLLYQVVRYEPKSFSQRRPDSNNGWINNLEGITPVLYHLPNLLIAKEHRETVYICEGEKDVDRLWDLGLVATCNSGGANQWKPQYVDELSGMEQVIVIPDKDEAGRKHAKVILQSLISKVNTLKVVEVEGDNKDVSDYFNNGGDIEAFLSLVERTPVFKPYIKINEEGGNKLMSRHFAPIKWIVPNMLPEGMALLTGTPKTGKSRMALNIALAVAVGGKALSKIDVKQGSVLYISLEDSDRRLYEHIKEIFGENIPDLEKITFRYITKLLNEGGLEDIETWLKAHTDARLVVIDTLQKIRPKESGGGALYAQDYNAVSPLTDLASRYNIAIIAVHHLNKRPTAEDPMELISGTTGLTGGVDTTIVVKRKRGESIAVMHIYSRDMEDAEIALDFTGGSWQWLGTEKQVRMSEDRKEILDLLKITPDLTPNAIAQNIGKNRNTIRRLLMQMVSDGQVSLFDGVYNNITKS